MTGDEFDDESDNPRDDRREAFDQVHGQGLSFGAFRAASVSAPDGLRKTKGVLMRTAFLTL